MKKNRPYTVTCKTVNNIKIVFDEGEVRPYKCYSPDGRMLEEFKLLQNATVWCQENNDFMKWTATQSPKGIVWVNHDKFRMWVGKIGGYDMFKVTPSCSNNDGYDLTVLIGSNPLTIYNLENANDAMERASSVLKEIVKNLS